MAGIYRDLLGGGINAAGLFDQIGRVQDIGEMGVARTGELASDVIEGTQFKPFSVASRTGNVDVSATGDINAQLSPEQAALAGQAEQGASALFEQAALDPNTRQGQIFEQLMAGLAPTQDRERLALEGRLQTQGRGGVRSAAHGGSPEQLALAKAQEEAKLNALVQARGIGLQEQGQQISGADTFLRGSQIPNAGLFNTLSPGLQAAQLAQAGQLSGQDTASQLNLAGHEGQLNAEVIASGLFGNLFGAAANVAGNVGGVIDAREDGVSVIDAIKDLF